MSAKVIEINSLYGGRAGTRTPDLLRVKSPFQPHLVEKPASLLVIQGGKVADARPIAHRSAHNSPEAA